MTKNEIIGKLIDLTKRGDSATFDKLIDRSEEYLGKLLKAVEKLSK